MTAAPTPARDPNTTPAIYPLSEEEVEGVGIVETAWESRDVTVVAGVVVAVGVIRVIEVIGEVIGVGTVTTSGLRPLDQSAPRHSMFSTKAEGEPVAEVRYIVTGAHRDSEVRNSEEAHAYHVLAEPSSARTVEPWKQAVAIGQGRVSLLEQQAASVPEVTKV
ncbi:hypothetical protein AJ80_07964 [Polytolypa hystricis UAMH7299]|uniref:Uncharacterized protein n=1 Tax=Polytolypa hystricis (strain UAMH7299) TaxID=1447883 RepID=A0A2B7XFS9_POLH7|nr:hypothetical protein AJ80_07964 [Polytolypa hystricis UAMH7299]